LSETARQILDLIPLDSHSTKTLNGCFTLLTSNNEQPTADECLNRLNNFYFHVSPSQMLYNLKTTLINFLPAHIHQICLQAHNNVEGLHVRFLNAGGLSCLLNILSDIKYTNQCDISTRKSIYFIVLYLLKRLLIILAIYQLRLTNSSSTNESLEQILIIMPTIPLPIMNVVGEQQITMSVEQKIAAALIAHRTDYPISKNSLLQYHHIRELIRLIWCLASDSKANSLEINLKNDFHIIHQTFKQDINLNNENEDDEESQLACREGLELLCISLSLVPSSVEYLLKENFFQYFFIDLILYCQYQIIRHTSSEQIFLLTSRCSQGQCEYLIEFILEKQFDLLNKSSNDLKNYSLQSSDFFLLLCRLLSYAYSRNISPPNIHQQLDDEIIYLKQILLPVDDHLLRGHLNIAKELLQFQTSEKKHYYGIDQALIQQIIEQYLFPASTLLYNFRLLRRKRLSKQSINNHDEDNELELLKEPPIAICQTPMSTLAAFDLLVVLGTNSIENLKLIDKYITDLFYTGNIESLN
jgi:ubiquitin carboxyl-terminal hydrolase 9/24